MKENIMAESILVTGGAGFIGSHLIERLLISKHHVVCLDNFDPYYDVRIKRNNISGALNHPNFSLYEGDINDQQLLSRICEINNFSLVIHLAAKAGVRPSIVNPEKYFLTNVIGTLSILECMKNYNIKKMIFASSSSVYGNDSLVPFSENSIVDFPISPYATTKKSGELLCHTYHHLYDFDIFCLRFFTVYGPRQRPDLAIHKFTDHILNNQPIEVYGDGSTSRDYTYIDDIIDGIVKSIELVKGYEIINLGESKPVSLNLMISTIEKCINKIALKKQFPMQPGDVNSTYADISKAKSLIGYLPSMDFEEGIKKFIKWKTG